MERKRFTAAVIHSLYTISIEIRVARKSHFLFFFLLLVVLRKIILYSFARPEIQLFICILCTINIFCERVCLKEKKKKKKMKLSRLYYTSSKRARKRNRKQKKLTEETDWLKLTQLCRSKFDGEEQAFFLTSYPSFLASRLILFKWAPIPVIHITFTLAIFFHRLMILTGEEILTNGRNNC
jgi:hypothetical protein